MHAYVCAYVCVCVCVNVYLSNFSCSGSRGVGNRIGEHFIALAKKDMKGLLGTLPDSNLAYAFMSENSTNGMDEWRHVFLHRVCYCYCFFNFFKHIVVASSQRVCSLTHLFTVIYHTRTFILFYFVFLLFICIFSLSVFVFLFSLQCLNSI